MPPAAGCSGWSSCHPRCQACSPGAKIAVVVAVIGAVFAEQAGANSGLGYLFDQSINQLLTARAYAAVVILSACSRSRCSRC